MGNSLTPAEPGRISVSLPPMRNATDFLTNPAQFAVFNPFDRKERYTLKTNIIKNLIYFQINYYLTSLYTYWLAILTFIVAEFVGGVVAFTITTSLFLTIVYLNGTGRLGISLNCGLQHVMTLVCVIAVLSSVLIRCVTHMYGFFLLLLGIVISMFPVLLHASLRVPDTQINSTVGAEYMGVTEVSFLFALSKAINKKVFVTWTVTGITALYCLYYSNTNFMFSLVFILILLIYLFLSSMLWYNNIHQSLSKLSETNRIHIQAQEHICTGSEFFDDCRRPDFGNIYQNMVRFDAGYDLLTRHNFDQN